MKKLLPIAFTGILLISLQIAYAQRKTSKSMKNRFMIVSCGVCNQKAIFLPQPDYPKAAKAVNVSGTVGVSILIDEKGIVTQAKVVSGHPLLRAESAKAALKAKFKPALLCGKPVKVYGFLTYNFVK